LFCKIKQIFSQFKKNTSFAFCLSCCGSVFAGGRARKPVLLCCAVRERERHSVVNWYFSIFEKIFGMEKFNMVYLEKWYISGILEKNLQNPKFYHIFSPKNAILVSKIFGNIAAAVKSENQVTLKIGTRPTNLSAISALGRQTCRLSRRKF
jgi:hypothetical protein